MAKLKEPLSSKKGKIKLGKIDKVKKSTEAFQMKKLHVKLPTSSVQKKGSATPFSKKPLTTSTPFHFDNKKPTNVKGFPLSPILSNTSNINRATPNNHGESGKNSVVGDKENLPKRASWDLEATNETVDAKFRVGTRKKLLLSSHDGKKQPRVRLPRLGTSSISISSASDSSASSSCDSSENRGPQKKSSEKSHLLKRLQSDWASTLVESPTVASKPYNTRVRTRSTRDSDSDSDNRQLYRQNKCSELRARSRRSTIDATTSEARRNQRSPKDNTLINNLRGDWTNLTVDATLDLNRNKQVSQKSAKRILQPLSESITEEKVIASGTQRVESKNKEKQIEDLIEEEEYSSSAEFQSDDEMNSLSRSKRAPTWGELLNKTNEKSLNESLGKRKRSPKIQLKGMHNMSLSKRTPSWGDLLDKTNENSSTVSVGKRSWNPRIQLKRMHNIESALRPEQQGEKSKKKKDLAEEDVKSKKNGKLNEVVEVPKDHEETTLRRSRRLSVKNVDNNSREQSLEEVPEPPKGKRKRTPKDASENKNLEEVNDVNQAKKAKTVQESEPRKSRRNSTTNGIEIDTSPDQKTVQRTCQNSSNQANQDHRRSTKTMNSVDNKNKNVRKSKEKKKRDSVVELEVSKNSSAQEEPQTRIEISGLDVNVSEQQTHTRKSNSTEKSPSSLQHRDTEKNISIDLTHPVKFFHSRLERTLCPPKPQAAISKPRNRSSKRNKKDSVYEFLSQSSSDSNNPVDDVIMKMIKSGKVVVAKHKKGTGKNVLPHTKPHRKRKKKTKTDQTTAKTTQLQISKPRLQEKIIEKEDVAPKFDHDDFHFNNNDNNFETQHDDHDDQVRDQRGFSNLARSAMIKQAQAGRIQKPLQKRKPIKDKKKLLEMAMKFVSQSTPVRVTTPQHQPMKSPNFSTTPIGAKSPWRIDDDKLPTAFYLGRNAQNLPSFSSDHIPMTPTKNKSKSMSSFSSNDSNGENQAPSGGNTITNQANYQSLANARKGLTYRSPLKAINIVDVVTLPPLAMHSYGKASKDKGQEMNNNSKETSVRSSPQKSSRNLFDNFSNQSPNNSKSGYSNENIENQLQNTVGQNTIMMRSFRSDNSLSTTNKKHSGSDVSQSTTNQRHSGSDVSQSTTNKRNSGSDVSQSTTNKRHSGSDVSQSTTNKRHSGSDVSLKTYSRRSGSDASTNNNNNNSITNLFGFKDLIDEDNNSPNFTVDKTILPNKDALKERLERLKKLRPNKPAIPSSTNKLTLNRIKPVFDEAPQPAQRSIKQMLCSTMIGNDNRDNMNNRRLDESQDLSNLFKDPDPETTFDDSIPRRTYKKPYKKKRKMYSQYAMFLESDVSDDEEEEEHQKTVKTYKPKSKKREKNNPQLKKFVNEFNEMCKEVSQYELIVE